MIGGKITKNLSHQEQKQAFDSLVLLGTYDVAELLNWSMSRVSISSKRGTFPQPIGYISGRPAWTKKQIEEFQKEGNRK